MNNFPEKIYFDCKDLYCNEANFKKASGDVEYIRKDIAMKMVKDVVNGLCDIAQDFEG